MGIPAFIGVGLDSLAPQPLWIGLVSFVVKVVLQLVIGVVLCVGVLTAIENSKISVNDLLGSLNIALIWRMFLANLLFMIGSAIGTVFLIIPGLIFCLGAIFYEFVIVEEEASPVAAIKRSFELTKGYRLKLMMNLFAVFVPMLLIAVIEQAVGIESAFLTLYVMLALPLTMLMLGYYYRQILATR